MIARRTYTNEDYDNGEISKHSIKCKLVVNDKIVQVSRYLGVETSSDTHKSEEVRTQATKAARISGYLRDTIWRNKHMSALDRCSHMLLKQEPILK